MIKITRNSNSDTKPITPLKYIGKSIASISVAALGCYCMYITQSATGIGWATIGLVIIWML